jgi:glutathione S-transferase
MDRMKIVGGPVSPYVRKVLAILALKKIDYEIDPIVAFYGDERFTRISPLRRIPVLIDGCASIADSSAIAQYLEETHPESAILPASPADRARARWLEEFADTRMGDVFIWKCFYSAVIAPAVWGQERDLRPYHEALAGPVPEIIDYLEGEAPKTAFLFGEIGLADISVGVMFRNLRYARFTPDAARWPKTAAWIGRVDAHPALAAANEWADRLVMTPIADHLRTARAIGMPVVSDSMFGAQPRRGPMTL